MKSKKVLISIFILVIATIGTPTLAATLEWVQTTLYFNVEQSQELTITLVNEGTSTVSSGTGATTSSSLNFTCGNPDCYWVNASLSGGGGTQDDTTPAINIKNTGTQEAQVNITSNVTDTFGIGSCMKLRYSNNTITYPPVLPLNNSMNVTLADTLNVYEELNVWLFANFTGCQDQTYVGQVRVYGYWT